MLAASGGDLMAEDAKVIGERAGEKDCPGHDPDGGEEPEERNRDLSVVVRDPSAEEAGDVLVEEIEPCPASGCGKTEPGRKCDGWGSQGGEDVPGGSDGQKDSCAGE